MSAATPDRVGAGPGSNGVVEAGAATGSAWAAGLTSGVGSSGPGSSGAIGASRGEAGTAAMGGSEGSALAGADGAARTGGGDEERAKRAIPASPLARRRRRAAGPTCAVRRRAARSRARTSPRRRRPRAPRRRAARARRPAARVRPQAAGVARVLLAAGGGVAAACAYALAGLGGGATSAAGSSAGGGSRRGAGGLRGSRLGRGRGVRVAPAASSPGQREVEDDVRGDLEPRGGDAAVLAAPGERGGPGFLGVGGPGLVVQDGDQAPAAAVDAQVQRRSHEAAAAHAEPATGDFESVVLRST